MNGRIMCLLFAVLANCMMGGAFAAVTGADALVCMAGANVVAGVAGGFMPDGAAMAGVFTEIWTGELVKKLNAGLTGSWLDGITDNSSIVENDVIHLVDCGVDPDVLINNTTYPIDLQALEDGDIPVHLDKFQTKVTPVTDDELYACSYDKMSRVKEAHGNAITTAKLKKAAHALSLPKLEAGAAFVQTSGDVDGGGATGRKMLTRADVIALKVKFDNAGVPVQGRRLVLCPDHVNDLLLQDQKFADQYYNYQTGKVSNLYGFEVYEFVNCPVYTKAGVKKDLGASATAGEYQASFAFWTERVFKATGSTKMYYSEAATDPEYQRNKINFTHRFIAMPKKMDACGVIMSAYKAS